MLHEPPSRPISSRSHIHPLFFILFESLEYGKPIAAAECCIPGSQASGLFYVYPTLLDHNDNQMSLSTCKIKHRVTC